MDVICSNYAMKTIVNSRLWLLVACWLCFACDRASRIDFDDPTENCSVAWLKAQAAGSVTTIRTAYRCEAVVTANDAYGELFHRLVVEDATAAITIVIERNNLYRTYPIGTTLSIDCNGLSLCDYGGKVELGMGLGDEGYTDGLNSADEARHLRIAAEATTHPEAQRSRFDEVTAAQIDRFVRFDGVRFVEHDTWCEMDPESGERITTERTLTDADGNHFIVRTLGSASYANEPLPEGEGSLCGVIDYFGGRYTLRVVNRLVLF